jgi:hypothetical protein
MKITKISFAFSTYESAKLPSPILMLLPAGEIIQHYKL